jgi:hypothetical protein
MKVKTGDKKKVDEKNAKLKRVQCTRNVFSKRKNFLDKKNF